MSKKDKHRDDAPRRRDFVIGLDRAGGWVEDRDPSPGPDAALAEPQDRSAPRPPSARREAIADEIRGMALEMVEECAQLSSLAVRLAAIDEASDEARTLARDALGASAAARQSRGSVSRPWRTNGERAVAPRDVSGSTSLRRSA